MLMIAETVPVGDGGTGVTNVGDAPGDGVAVGDGAGVLLGGAVVAAAVGGAVVGAWVGGGCVAGGCVAGGGVAGGGVVGAGVGEATFTGGSGFVAAWQPDVQMTVNCA